MNKKLVRKKLQRGKNDFIYYCIRALLFLARLVPRPLGLRLFESFAALFHALPTADRKRARKHAADILGEHWSQAETVQFVKKAYRSFGKNMYDAWYLSRSDRDTFDSLVKFDGLDDFASAYKAGNGVVAVTGHIGCFELLLQFFARHGFESFAVGRKLFDKRIDEIAQKVRSGERIAYLERKGSAKTIVKYLKEGRTFGALIDQDTGLEGVFAHFLGRLAHTPSAPLRIAMKFKIPVFVVTTSRLADNTHLVKVGKQIELEDTGDFDRDLCLNAEKVNTVLSEAILRSPEQWVWMHRRWRKQPSSRGCGELLNVENYL